MSQNLMHSFSRQFIHLTIVDLPVPMGQLYSVQCTVYSTQMFLVNRIPVLPTIGRMFLLPLVTCSSFHWISVASAISHLSLLPLGICPFCYWSPVPPSIRYLSLLPLVACHSSIRICPFCHWSPLPPSIRYFSLLPLVTCHSFH